MWGNEYAPGRYREGGVVNLLWEGDKAGPGNYRGKTLLKILGKTLCKLSNDRMETMMEKGDKICKRASRVYAKP